MIYGFGKMPFRLIVWHLFDHILKQTITQQQREKTPLSKPTWPTVVVCPPTKKTVLNKKKENPTTKMKLNNN